MTQRHYSPAHAHALTHEKLEAGKLPRFVELYISHLETETKALRDALQVRNLQTMPSLIKVEPSVLEYQHDIAPMYLPNDAHFNFADKISLRYAHRARENRMGLIISADHGRLAVLPEASNMAVIRDVS